VSSQMLARNTLAKRAYEQLRQRIVDGRLAPGSRVVVRPLCAELGLSPTPIRAALSALEREGFLVSTAHRGYTVPQMSLETVRNIFELRGALDGIAARRAAVSPSAETLVRKLHRLLDSQRLQIDVGNLSRYSDLDLTFHRQIWHASGNTRLVDVAETLSGQIRLGSGSSSQVPGRLPPALDEHAAIIEALQSGDGEAAAEAARAHVHNASVALDHYVAADDGRSCSIELSAHLVDRN